jgi:hypothetical protein
LRAKSKKVTTLQEEVIVAYILDLDARGFPPSLDAARNMANKLLAEREAEPVGIKWPYNFVKRKESLTTRLNEPYDYRRAQCEDPVVVRSWFERVQRAQAAYEILPENTYNFDEVGFTMGRTLPHVVVTGTERRGRRKAVQLGNREWATVV